MRIILIFVLLNIIQHVLNYFLTSISLTDCSFLLMIQYVCLSYMFYCLFVYWEMCTKSNCSMVHWIMFSIMRLNWWCWWYKVECLLKLWNVIWKGCTFLSLCFLRCCRYYDCGSFGGIGLFVLWRCSSSSCCFCFHCGSYGGIGLFVLWRCSISLWFCLNFILVSLVVLLFLLHGLYCCLSIVEDCFSVAGLLIGSWHLFSWMSWLPILLFRYFDLCFVLCLTFLIDRNKIAKVLRAMMHISKCLTKIATNKKYI